METVDFAAHCGTLGNHPRSVPWLSSVRGDRFVRRAPSTPARGANGDS